MEAGLPSVEDNLRRSVLVPCESKEDLHEWLMVYFGLDFPDHVVAEGSTSSPMDTIWTIYDAFRCRRFNLPDKAKYAELKEVMAYSSRDSFKTLAASALEVVVLLHMCLSVAHMAAIEKQSKKAQQYVKEMLSKEYVRDYVTVRNETRSEILRYKHRVSSVVLNHDEYEDLPITERKNYDRQWNYITIVICTMAGANSEHVPFMVVDEVDVVPKQNVRAYEEAKLIPSQWEGVMPITLYTSTRKFSFGLVQKELDEAHETGLQNWHWNIIDVTNRCPPERHLPDRPQIDIYFAEPQGQLRGRAIPMEEWSVLAPEKQALYHRTKGYAGCLKNCKLFFACKGKLVNQPGTSNLLKDIDHTTGLFRKVSPGMANAQLLCKKPSEEGLIYPHLDRALHVLTPAQMAEKLTGDEYPPTFSRENLIELMFERGLEFASGMDHGHAHNFAVVTGARDGNRMFIIDVQSHAELEVDFKVALMDNTIKRFDSRIYGDTEDPGSNKYIKRRGYRIMDWVKEPGSVVGGIEIVRAQMYPAVGDPKLYFLADDPGVELLFARMSKYHWTLDEAGRPTNIPDEENDDECDAVRYLVMNEFKPKGRVIVDREAPGEQMPAKERYIVPTAERYLDHFIQQHLGTSAPEFEAFEEGVVVGKTARGGKGKFHFDI